MITHFCEVLMWMVNHTWLCSILMVLCQSNVFLLTKAFMFKKGVRKINQKETTLNRLFILTQSILHKDFFVHFLKINLFLQQREMILNIVVGFNNITCETFQKLINGTSWVFEPPTTGVQHLNVIKRILILHECNFTCNGFNFPFLKCGVTISWQCLKMARSI